MDLDVYLNPSYLLCYIY